jgi:hypothetical protein
MTTACVKLNHVFLNRTPDCYPEMRQSVKAVSSEREYHNVSRFEIVVSSLKSLSIELFARLRQASLLHRPLRRREHPVKKGFKIARKMTDAIETHVSSAPLSVSSACRTPDIARATLCRYRGYDPLVDMDVEPRPDTLSVTSSRRSTTRSENTRRSDTGPQTDFESVGYNKEKVTP